MVLKKPTEAWGIFSFFYSKCKMVERQAPLPITLVLAEVAELAAQQYLMKNKS